MISLTISSYFTNLFGNSFQSVIQQEFDIKQYLICTLASLILGLFIALSYMYKGQKYTTSFVIALATMPAIVQTVIMIVNGNIGTGIAVIGVFGLVRFRSVPGTAKEIAYIFFTMTVGLATGSGIITGTVIFTIMLCLVNILYNAIGFGKKKTVFKNLKVVIPESLNYTHCFDDIFEEYCKEAKLDSARTTNMGSLYKLNYSIILKDKDKEKEMIDKIRERNGNLDIVCGTLQDREIESL